MAAIYHKKKEEDDEKTINAVEYINRMFSKKNQDEEKQEPKIESTK